MGKEPHHARKPHHAPLTTNQKVVIFAQSRLGREVGKGECWDLAEKALKEAGAETSTDLSSTGSVGPDDDYVWGDKIDIKDVEPGDIIQFRDYVVTTETQLDIEFSNKLTESISTSSDAERGHHTALANGKLRGDGTLPTFEQHVKPLGEKVQHKVLFTRDVAPLTTTTHERRKNPKTHKMEMAKVTKTVTIKTKGEFWVYHPKKK